MFSSKALKHDAEAQIMNILEYGQYEDENQEIITIKNFIFKHPLCINVRNKYGLFPIHVAVLMNRSLAIIKLLVNANPASITWTTPQDNLPIHYAVTKPNKNIDLVNYLVELWPQSLQMRNYLGYLPIHSACEAYIHPHINESKSNESIIKYLVNKCPESLMGKSNSDDLPIHFFCRTNFQSLNDSSLLVDIVQRCPLSIYVHNIHGCLPIHCLCQANNNPDIISKFIEYYPKSLTFMTQSKLSIGLPIHAAMDHTLINESTVKYLMKCYPDSLGIENGCGKLPLHYACQNNASLSLIVEMIQLYAESVYHKASDGDLPIHLACRGCIKSPEKIKYLIHCNPSALVSVGSKGQVPLFEIINQSHGMIDYDIIRLIVKIHPESVHVSSYAAYEGITDDLLYRILINADPKNITSSSHMMRYRDMNWFPRSAAIQSLILLCRKS